MDIVETPSIRRAAALLGDLTSTWGIAGGWALDLFLGRQTRQHADVDVALLRADQAWLRTWLTGGRAVVRKVVDHELLEWAPDEVLSPPIHEIHATWPDGFNLEFLLNEHEADEWVFRRDGRIRLPLANAFLRRGPVPYLAPEIVLLYKSKSADSKDEADFAATLAHLGESRREWLCNALAITAPDHRWVRALTRVG